MTTQGEYKQKRCMWLGQLYWNISKALLLASLINGDFSTHGQHHGRAFQCHEEGYHADPTDCQTYYRCVAWGNNSPLTKFDFKCGPGTVFSHANGDICVHPRESERSECQESGNDLDSNMNYPENNEGHFPNYEQSHTSPNYMRPPAEPSYQQPQAPPNYGTWPDRPDYQQTQTSRPNYGSSHFPPSYEPSYPSASTESPSINEVDQPAYLPASQSPISTTSRPPSPTTTVDNSIPHPISTTTGTGIAPDRTECQREGFFANSNNCKEFFRCVGDGRGSYLKYDFTCGEGTVWDPMTEGCNHAWAVSRDDCRTTQDIDGDNNGNNGQDVDQSQSSNGDHDSNMTSQQSGEPDVTQASVYPSYPSSQSPNGYPVSTATTATTSAPTYIPPSEATTQSPPLTSRPSSTPVETEHETSMLPDYTSSPSYGINGDGGPPESSSMHPSGTDHSSASECVEEGFFADPNDCMKFYRCVQDVSSLRKYEFTCGEGTAWDQSIQSCNHIYAVNSCSGKDHNNEHTTASGGGDSETSTQDHGENQSSTTNPSVTSETTTSFETSSSPMSSLETSSASEVPSKPTMSTETPSSVGESLNMMNETTQRPEEMTQSSATTPPTTTSDKQESTTTSSSGTDKDQETSTQEVEKTEPGMTTPLSSSTPSESSSPPGSSSLLPTTQSSTVPESSSPKQEESSEPSTSGKEPSSTTIPQMPSHKPDGSTGDAECHDEGFLPHSNDCRKFLRCVSNGGNGFTKYTFECGPGTAWDQSLLTCNYIEKVTSCGSESNEIPSGTGEQMPTKSSTESMSTSTTAPKEEQVNGDASTTNSPQDEKKTTESLTASSTESNNLENNTTSKSPGNETSQKPNGSGDCSTAKPSNNGIVCEVEGFHANPTYCGKFYRCVDNGNGFNVYHFDCPGGTIFDPSINVCNYPESVYPQRDCSGGEVSAPSPSSESPSATEPTKNPSPTESSAETTTIEASSESGSEIIGTEGSVTEIMTELISGGETSTESVTELSSVEETSTESSTDANGSTESTTEMKTTVGGETTNAVTEAGITEMQTTTELSQESMTTEGAMTTEKITEPSTTVTDSSSTDNPESTQPSLEQTTVGKDDLNSMATPCPIGNLTDEQIVLVCPTGFRRHPKYCNMFYQCSNEDDMKIKVLVLGCPEGTIYDEEKIQCRPESESSQKCDTQIATSRFYRQLEKFPVSPIRVRRNGLCPDEGHYPYQQGCGNAFYKCTRNSRNELQGYLYRCPEDYVYWSVSRRCERANRMICSHGKYGDYERMQSWENRWDLPIEQSNISS